MYQSTLKTILLASALLILPASMSAQTITPVLLGLVLNASLAWNTLPVYCMILIVLSFTVFTLLVKNIKAKKVSNAHGLEALGDED